MRPLSVQILSIFMELLAKIMPNYRSVLPSGVGVPSGFPPFQGVHLISHSTFAECSFYFKYDFSGNTCISFSTRLHIYLSVERCHFVLSDPRVVDSRIILFIVAKFPETSFWWVDC